MKHSDCKDQLVSIVTICRNSERTIRRCIESVLSQDYPHVEYIIQDGASTDRTLEIIKSYRDSRIKLLSEPDSGGTDAFFRGLRRCTGKIITLCWSDEELLPHAVRWGVTALAKNPSAAVIYGDVYCTDINGTIDANSQPGTEWDLVKFLCWEIMPNYCASFMRMERLREAGFFEFTSSFIDAGKTRLEETNCVMYDYFAMVGIRHPILYVPHYVGKFSVHHGQLSSNPNVLFSMLPGLFRSIDRVCDDPATPPSIRDIRLRAYGGVHLSMINSLLVNAGDFQSAREMLRKALQYRPAPEFLARVCTESCNHLLKQGEIEHAIEFLDTVEEMSSKFPGFRHLQALTYVEAGKFQDAHKVMSNGLAAHPDDQQLLALRKQFTIHQERERILADRMSLTTDREERRVLEQLIYFMSLTEHRTRQRLGQIMNAGFSSDSLLAAANLLYCTVCTSDFLTAVREASPESCPLIEKTLVAYLALMIEQNAAELALRVAESLTDHFSKKDKDNGVPAGHSMNPGEMNWLPSRYARKGAPCAGC
jgi:tetratricopeptide (TPR) repeat protein